MVSTDIWWVVSGPKSLGYRLRPWVLQDFLGVQSPRATGGDPWDPEVILQRPHYLKPHLILTLWPGCRVKTCSRGEGYLCVSVCAPRGGVVNGRNAAEGAAVTGRRLCPVYVCKCAFVLPLWGHLGIQMLKAERTLSLDWAVFIIFVCKLYKWFSSRGQ